MSLSRSRSLPLVALVTLLAGVRAGAQEQLDLRAQRQMSADDADVFAARLERLTALLGSGLSGNELSELKGGLLRSCTTVVISGDVREAPLSDVLLSIVRSAREQGKGPSLVIRPEDLAALSEVRVSAMFSSTRASDAVRSLLRSQDAAQTLSLEVTEENDVFVVAVHRWEEDRDEDARRKQQPEEDEDEQQPMPEEEAAVPGYLGISSEGAVLANNEVVLSSVAPGSPAAAGGLLAGDAIAAFDGTAVTTWDELRARIRAKSAGEDVVLDVLRDGQRRRVLVTLGRAP